MYSRWDHIDVKTLRNNSRQLYTAIAAEIVSKTVYSHALCHECFNSYIINTLYGTCIWHIHVFTYLLSN